MKRCVNCHKTMYDWLPKSSSSWCGCEEVKAWSPSYGETEQDAKSYYTRDSEDLASEIGKELYNDDPMDPAKFKATICIKGIQGGIETFEITAEADINFYASTIS